MLASAQWFKKWAVLTNYMHPGLVVNVKFDRCGGTEESLVPRDGRVWQKSLPIWLFYRQWRTRGQRLGRRCANACIDVGQSGCPSHQPALVAYGLGLVRQTELLYAGAVLIGCSVFVLSFYLLYNRVRKGCNSR